MPDDPRPRARALLARLLSRTGAGVPTGMFGRLRRTAGAAIRGTVLRRKEPDAETLEQLVLSLGELKGVAMKMGQILSYVDDSLPAESRELLALLRTWSPPTAYDDVARIVRDDLGGRAADLLGTMEREPVSSASIGQVHRARLSDGIEVAVKVRHPGIEEALRTDFRTAKFGLPLARLLAPGIDPEELVEEARATFLEECDYVLEARRQTRFAAIHARDAILVVPEVHQDWCSGRVLTSGWKTGLDLDRFLETDPKPSVRAGLGRALYEFYVGNLYRHGLFNADPHPGNLLFTGEHVVVLDCGCVREFDSDTVRMLAILSRSVRDDHDSAIRDALALLGARLPSSGEGFDETRALLRGFYGPTLERGVRPVRAGVSLMSLAARDVFSRKLALLRLRLPAKLLFLFRIRFGLWAVLARLGAEIDWRALESELTEAATP